MKHTKRFIQAYRQAPWRGQLQVVGFVVAAIAVLALIAGIYLDVTARAATAGRAVQELQAAREELEQDIEDLETELAYLRSVEVMQARAEKLSFEPLTSAALTYLTVPGYTGRPESKLAPSPSSQFAGAFRLPAEYTQSLLNWFGGILDAIGGR